MTILDSCSVPQPDSDIEMDIIAEKPRIGVSVRGNDYNLSVRHESIHRNDNIPVGVLLGTNRSCNVADDSAIEAVGEESLSNIRHRHNMSHEMDITVQGTARTPVC